MTSTVATSPTPLPPTLTEMGSSLLTGEEKQLLELKSRSFLYTSRFLFRLSMQQLRVRRKLGGMEDVERPPTTISFMLERRWVLSWPRLDGRRMWNFRVLRKGVRGLWLQLESSRMLPFFAILRKSMVWPPLGTGLPRGATATLQVE